MPFTREEMISAAEAYVDLVHMPSCSTQLWSDGERERLRAAFMAIEMVKIDAIKPAQPERPERRAFDLVAFAMRHGRYGYLIALVVLAGWWWLA